MRLANGIVVDQEKTFGELKFSALRRDNFKLDADGNVTTEVETRTYDLKSKGQGGMIQVKIPVEAGEKDFEYNTEVEMVNPVVNTISNATFRGAEVGWYIKADDIVPKKAASLNNTNTANVNVGQNHKDKDKDVKNNNGKA